MVWDYFNTTKYEDAMEYAKNAGWKDKKVQVRVEFEGQIARYFIEPWEKDCSCPHILKYSKHFPDPT